MARLFALMILAAELPVLTRSFELLADPASAMPAAFREIPLLLKGGRLLEVDDLPVHGKNDIADAILRRRDSGSLAITTRPKGREIVQLTAPPENPKYPWNRIAGAHWMTRMIWPAACVLLAVAILLTAGMVSTKTVMIPMALLYLGHISWITVSPYEFPGAARTLLILYEAAVLALGPVAVVWCGLRLPKPLLPDVPLFRIAAAILLAWGLLQTYVALAEMSSYHLLRGWESWSSTYTFTGVMLPVAAACVVVFRYLFLAGHGTVKVLQQSTLIAVGAFCFYFAMGPLFLGQYLESVSWISWIAGLGVLGFPAALARLGLDGEPTSESSADDLHAAVVPATWPEAFQQIDAEARKSSLQLLALYERTGEQMQIRYAPPGSAVGWPTLGTGSPPSDKSGLLLWSKAGEDAILLLGKLESNAPAVEAIPRLTFMLERFVQK